MYQKNECFRGEICAYLNFVYDTNDSRTTVESELNTENENDDENMNVIGIDTTENDIDEVSELNIECFKCGEKEEVNNKCENCSKHFCSKCEWRFNGESVMAFYKSYNYTNYTCLTAHY